MITLIRVDSEETRYTQMRDYHSVQYTIRYTQIYHMNFAGAILGWTISYLFTKFIYKRRLSFFSFTSFSITSFISVSFYCFMCRSVKIAIQISNNCSSLFYEIGDRTWLSFHIISHYLTRQIGNNEHDDLSDSMKAWLIGIFFSTKLIT